MYTWFFVSGVFGWLLVATIVALGVARWALDRRKVRRLLWKPNVFPRVAFVLIKAEAAIGWVMARVFRSGRVTERSLEARRRVTVDTMREYSEVMNELAKLPTVATGLKALGLESVTELPPTAVRYIPSPYTHPLQYPAIYIPGVPARMFYEPAEFEWARPLEDAFPVIRDELMQLLADKRSGFKTYVSEGEREVPGWNTFNFFFFGRKFEENCARCPKTTALLESLPRFERDHIMFSALNPHSRIPPHTGQMNGILRAHLPLVARPGAFIRVGSEERTWEEGRLMVFDDSFEHEVWNHSDYVRIVLFMNFWHPCFRADEIPVLERLRAAYERHPKARVWADNQEAERPHTLQPARALA